MIVSDLDGTIFNSFKEPEISRELIKEVHKFEQEGKIFTIATGRPKETSLDVIKKLGGNPIIAGSYSTYGNFWNERAILLKNILED